jgi:hypothetical protein
MTQINAKKIGEHKQLLIDGLNEIPATWALTPVYGDKRPYRKNWQTETPITKDLIKRDIRNGKAKGYGLRTGTVSGGIVAVDADGRAAHEKINELSGGVPLPETVAFTSDKPGRCQYLFYIPQEYWGAIATKKISTGVKGDDGKEQKLELRWDGCQSVLPPSVHPETGFYRWRKSPSELAIAPAPMWVIEAMLVEPEPTHHEPEDPTSYTAESRSNQKWTDEEWALSYLSALSSYRADDYESWLAVGMALHSISDSLLTEWDNWSRQSQKYKPGDCEKKWKSFKSSGVAIGTLAHMAKQDGWISPFKSFGRSYGGGIGSGGGKRPGNGGSGGSGSGDGNEPPARGNKILTHPAWTPLSPDELLREINSLIDRGLPDSEIALTIPNLAKCAGYTESATWKIYHERLLEVEVTENRAETSALVDLLLKAREATVTLQSVLPLGLAEPFAKYCGWLNIRPEVVLLTFLTTVSGLHHTATTCWLNKDWDFDVKPNLFTAIVAPPSQKKSPILRTIAKKPLRVLERKARDAWKKAVTDYRATEQHYNSLTKEQKEQEFPDGLPDPPPDRRKIHSFTDTTSEGLRNQIEAYPMQGLIALPDELARLIKSANKYRGGKGSDEEDLLSYYDGGGETVLRADGLAGDFDNLLLAVLGSIQPGVLQKMIKDCQDENGKWARFQFVVQPLAPSVMSADGGSFDLTPMLANLYERINNLPPQDYKPEREAFAYYCSIYNEFERRRVSESHPGLSAAWGKAEGRVGKLACNLHVVHELLAGRTPSEFIPKQRYEQAFAIAMFSMQQVFSLYNELGDENALATHLTKVITLSQRKGKIVARDVQLLYDSKSRPTPDAVRSWFRELEAMNKGKTSGTGRTLSFTASVEFVEQKVENYSTFESYINQGVQPNVENVEKCGVFSLKISYPEITQNTVVAEINLSEIFSTSSTDSTIASTVEEMVVLAVEISSTENSTNATEKDSDDDPEPPSPGPGGGVVEPPTLAELQALLLACQSLSELSRVQAKHKEQAQDAYRAMSLENQLQIDGLTATQYKEPIFKYIGTQILGRNGHCIGCGSLVRLKNGKKHLLTDVLPLDGRRLTAEEEELGAISVNPKKLVEVVKRYAPPQGEQLSFA